MVQDKERLSEVGLQPDRPSGHIRGIWAITLIVAFSIVVVGGIYFLLWYAPWDTGTSVLTPRKQNLTSDWNTYNDDARGTRFKYPKDWEYKDFTTTIKGVSFFEEDKKDQVESSQWNEIASPPGDIAYYVDTSKNLDGTITAFEKEEPDCTVSDREINDLEAKYLECPVTEGSGTVYYYLFGDEGRTFYLLTDKAGQKARLKLMAETFEFAQVMVTSQTEWSIYTNDKYGYSFEYPADTKPTSGSGSDQPVYELESGQLAQFRYGDKSSFLVATMDYNTNEYSTIEQALGDDLSKWQKTTSVAGETAYKISFTPSTGPGYQDIVRFLHNGRLYEIRGTYGGTESYECGEPIGPPCQSPSSKEEGMENIFNHILTSFKFV